MVNIRHMIVKDSIGALFGKKVLPMNSHPQSDDKGQ